MRVFYLVISFFMMSCHWGEEIPKTLVKSSKSMTLTQVDQLREAKPKQAEFSVLDKPMTNKKMLVAHFMTGDIDYDFQARPGGLSRDENWYSREGEFKAFGGLNQVAPMDMFLYKRGERSLEQVIEQELTAADVAGLDAFHFYYPEVNHAGFMNNYNEVIKTFFRVGAKRFPHFKFTLCLSNANEGLEADKIQRWGKHIRTLVESVKDYDSWLKTPDGRTVFYLWNNDALADIMEHKPWLIDQYPERIKEVAEAHQKLAEAMGLSVAFMYDLRFPANKLLTAKILEYFPGVWSWTDNTKHLTDFREIAASCRVKKRDFCLTVYPDYYTSKVYWKARWRGHSMLRYQDLKKATVENTDRHYQNCGLSLLYRKLFDFAIEQDLQWISMATWNDFPEGHHIAPEINHNFAPMVLMEYYRNQWRQNKRELKESLSVFYKKYKHDIKPAHDISIMTKETIGDSQLEDFIEVVSILDEAGDIYINGKHAGRVQAGLQTVKIPTEVGRVIVELKRDGKIIKSLMPPEGITDKPYRTDRLTYMYSTRFDEYFTKIFGEGKSAPQSTEYAPQE